MIQRITYSFFAAAAVVILTGCSATYHQDCTFLLRSDPPEAEIWKEDFFIGYTPRVLRYTATSADTDLGYLRLPPLTLKKKGFKSYHLEEKLDISESFDWEATVTMEAAEEE